jgi:hypothetical protein
MDGRWIRDSHVLAPWLVPTASLVVLATVQHSALNKLWAAASKDFQIGEFDVPVSKKAGSKLPNDTELAKKLWDWTAKELHWCNL